MAADTAQASTHPWCGSWLGFQVVLMPRSAQIHAKNHISALDEATHGPRATQRPLFKPPGWRRMFLEQANIPSMAPGWDSRMFSSKKCTKKLRKPAFCIGKGRHLHPVPRGDHFLNRRGGGECVHSKQRVLEWLLTRIPQCYHLEE